MSCHMTHVSPFGPIYVQKWYDKRPVLTIYTNVEPAYTIPPPSRKVRLSIEAQLRHQLNRAIENDCAASDEPNDVDLEEFFDDVEDDEGAVAMESVARNQNEKKKPLDS